MKINMKYTEQTIFEIEYRILDFLSAWNSKKHKSQQGISIYDLGRICKTDTEIIQKIMSILLGQDLVTINSGYLIAWATRTYNKCKEKNIDRATIFTISEQGKKTFNDNRNLYESSISYESFRNDNLIIYYYYNILMALENEKMKQAANIRYQLIPIINSINKIINKTKKIDVSEKSSVLDPYIEKMIHEVHEIHTVLKPKQSIKKQKNINKKICYIETPDNTTWQDIAIQFIDAQDVILRIKGMGSIHTNYKNLGFENEKNRQPNRQWELLCELSKNEGTMSWDNNKRLSMDDIDALKHRKKALADTLKACFFQIDGEPFYCYRKKKAYEIKIYLIPEPDSQPKQETRKIVHEDDLGIEDSYKEQTQ